MTPITTTADLETFCAKILGQPFVAVDTEFMRETTYWPKLCLIQAATPDDEAVIDPLAPGLDLEPFLRILRDESIVKVFHAARQDVEIFHNLKAMPRPLFDTQVAAMAGGRGGAGPSAREKPLHGTSQRPRPAARPRSRSNCGCRCLSRA